MLFRILSLDGGGIRGAYAAACLARIEKELNDSITNYFDLIAGTSTGGIIALALGLGVPAENIRKLYEQRGPLIFTPRGLSDTRLWQRAGAWLLRRRFPQFSLSGLLRSKYLQEPLSSALEEVYGDRTLEEVRSSRLVIPAVDTIGGRTIVFETPHRPEFIRDRHLRAVDIALATAAAPTYFPHSSISEGSAYTDGGLWANNPAIVAYIEAVKIREECKREGLDNEFGIEDISMVSIGTGKPRYYANPGDSDDGLCWWGPRLFEIASGAQSQGAHFQALHLMGEDRYLRIDFDMPTEPWALDNVGVLNQLLYFGEQAATDKFSRLKRVFLTEKKPKFYPFNGNPGTVAKTVGSGGR